MLDKLMSLARIDFAPRHRQPLTSRLPVTTVASVASIAGSLAADAILVLIGQAVFPGTGGYCTSSSQITPNRR